MILKAFIFIWRESPIFPVVYVPLILLGGALDGAGAALVFPILNSLNAADGGELPGPLAAVIEYLDLDPVPLTLAGLVAAVVIVKAIIAFNQRYFAYRIGLAYERRAKTDIFSNLLRSKWTYMQDQTSGKIINTSLVEMQRCRYVFSEVSEITASSIFVLSYALIGLALASKTFAFGIIVGTILASAYVFINKRVLRLGQEATEINLTAQNYLTDSLQGIKFIKSSAISGPVISRYSSVLDSFERNWRRYFGFFSLSSALGEPMTLTILLAVILFHFSTGQDFNSFLATAFILFRMQGRVNYGFGRIQKLLNLIPALQAVEQLRGQSRRHREATGSQPFERLRQAIELRGVVFGHTAGTTVLNGCNVTFETGQTTALVGTSGSGKTTIVDLVLGLYEPTGGSVTVDGINLTELDIESYRRAIGIVPQEPVMFNDSVFNNITLAKPDASREEVESAAKLAFAHEFIEIWPNGYDTQVGERGVKMSGGQKQRIALARALLNNPNILILDEATSALDTDSESRIKAALRELHGQMTIIIIAHRTTTIEDADRVVRVENGRCHTVELSEDPEQAPKRGGTSAA